MQPLAKIGDLASAIVLRSAPVETPSLQPLAVGGPGFDYGSSLADLASLVE